MRGLSVRLGLPLWIPAAGLLSMLVQRRVRRAQAQRTPVCHELTTELSELGRTKLARGTALISFLLWAQGVVILIFF